jgi:hypothetical protein
LTVAVDYTAVNEIQQQGKTAALNIRTSYQKTIQQLVDQFIMTVDSNGINDCAGYGEY